MCRPKIFQMLDPGTGEAVWLDEIYVASKR